MTEEELTNWFSYHAPEGDDLHRYAAIRYQAHELAKTINHLCPDSADKTCAIRHVRDAGMTANASIACRGK
jgi:hypothetical protein